jgi:hypothetical protein
MITLMVRFWTVYHLIVFTILSIFIYFGWIFIEDGLTSEDISSSQGAIWASPLFYLVVLLNAGWLIAFEVGLRLVQQESKLSNNIELLDNELKKPDCTIDERMIAKRLSLES